MPRHPSSPLLVLAVLVLAVLAGACATSEEADTSTVAGASETEVAGASAAEGAGASEPAGAGTTETPSVTPNSSPEASMTRPSTNFDEPTFPVTGTFDIESVEGGCATIEVDGQRYELTAGPDSSLAIDPANGVIASGTGQVIAGAGDQITVDGLIDPGIMTFCQVGPVMVATDIQPA